MKRPIKRILHKLFAYIRHPFGVTCLQCGFLAIGEHELITSRRIMLHWRGRAGCPPLDEIHCQRSFWVELDLTYPGNYPGDELIDEVNKNQRECKGFFKYKPGWSPSGHLDLLAKSTDRKKNLIYSLITGFFGGLFAIFIKWLAVRFGFIA